MECKTILYAKLFFSIIDKKRFLFLSIMSIALPKNEDSVAKKDPSRPLVGSDNASICLFELEIHHQRYVVGGSSAEIVVHDIEQGGGNVALVEAVVNGTP